MHLRRALKQALSQYREASCFLPLWSSAFSLQCLCVCFLVDLRTTIPRSGSFTLAAVARFDEAEKAANSASACVLVVMSRDESAVWFLAVICGEAPG